MTVDILMSTYNRASMVGKAINSILSQTYTDWTLTIIDDCSPDNTWVVLQKYKKEPRIRLVLNRKNLGSGFCKHPYMITSSKKYIAILDDDDLWDPKYLYILVNALEIHPEYKIAYSDAWRVYPDGNRKYWNSSKGKPFPNILPSCSIYRSNDYKETGGWDIEAFKFFHTEADFYFRIGWPENFIHIPMPLVTLGTPPNAMSSDKKKCAEAELDLIDKNWTMLQSNKKTLGELYARVGLHYAEAGKNKPAYFAKAIKVQPTLIEAWAGLVLILINRKLFLWISKLYRRILGYV